MCPALAACDHRSALWQPCCAAGRPARRSPAALLRALLSCWGNEQDEAVCLLMLHPYHGNVFRHAGNGTGGESIWGGEFEDEISR